MKAFVTLTILLFSFSIFAQVSDSLLKIEEELLPPRIRELPNSKNGIRYYFPDNVENSLDSVLS
jgi:hypothetical protein